jgi:hypothetical protein
MRERVKRVPGWFVAALATAVLLWDHVEARGEQLSGREMAPNCRYTSETVEGVPVHATSENTLVFNHRELTTSPQRLHVLKVDHGDYFQVVFECTAHAYFDYTVTGDPALQPDSGSGTVGESVMVPVPLSVYGITMRHDARFLRYRVTARVRAGVTPVAPGTVPPPPPPPPTKPPVQPGQPEESPAPSVQLYSVAFDVWVITGPEWRYGVIGGVAISGLRDTKYEIATAEGGAKQFVEAPKETQSEVGYDTMALANVYYSRTFLRTMNFGAAVGFGTSSTSARLFFGPSVVFGRYFVFTGGWALGNIATPPQGQALGKAPVNDNALNSLGSRVTLRPYFGLGFTWIDRRDQFDSALAAASASGSVGSCVTAVKPAAVTFDAKGVASAAIEVEAGADCTWTATLQSGTNLFTVASGGSGRGKGVIKLSTGAAQEGGRSDVLNIVGPPGSAAKQVKLSQGPPS